MPDTTITHTPLSSSNIKSAGYDAESRTMEITFHSGTTWRYHGVAPHHWENLTTATSAGAYFHRAIRAAHQAVQVS